MSAKIYLIFSLEIQSKTENTEKPSKKNNLDLEEFFFVRKNPTVVKIQAYWLFTNDVFLILRTNLKKSLLFRNLKYERRFHRKYFF